MSRIGNMAISIPSGVEVSAAKQKLTVRGELGCLNLTLPNFLKCRIKNQTVQLTCQGQGTFKKANHGLFRSLLNNAIIGCSKGFEKKLEIHGVGYKAQTEGQDLVLNLGFSHPVKLLMPEDLKVSVQKNIIVVSGIDKQKVGQFSSQIRSLKKPDPYKGKGIRYQDEIVKIKPGKIAKTVGA